MAESSVRARRGKLLVILLYPSYRSQHVNWKQVEPETDFAKELDLC